MTSLLPQKVNRELCDNGDILLSSGYEMGPVENTTGEWLKRWAAKTPSQVFLAERSGEGWREENYQSSLEKVIAIASALLAKGLNSDKPIIILSGNGVDHGLLSLAAQFVGIPVVPVAEQYSLIPEAHDRLRHVLNLTKPAMAYVVDSGVYKKALDLPEMSGVEIIASRVEGGNAISFDTLLSGSSAQGVEDAHAALTSDSVAKILLTSGSTSMSKGVITTHGMLCANQTQVADLLPFLKERSPSIVDWLPWNHVFGGSHNFNLMLANGGSLYIDEGKPVKGLFDRTLANMSMICGSLVFNVPLGFSMMLDALKKDKALRTRFFADLDMVFYSGASLPQDIWSALAEMGMQTQGKAPLVTSSWGLTETAPAALLQHEQSENSGVVGVPVTGVTARLIQQGDDRFEIRIKGPNVTPGYHSQPEKTADSFDEDGYFITGDAMRFVDIDKPEKGLRFDGRLGEDFKLMSGTWVQAANLRLDVLPLLTPFTSDLVITGANRSEIGLLIFPSSQLLAKIPDDISEHNGALLLGDMAETVVEALRTFNAENAGSARSIKRVLVLAEPPNMGAGEITAKGNLNSNRILQRREALLARLYDDTDKAALLTNTANESC